MEDIELNNLLLKVDDRKRKFILNYSDTISKYQLCKIAGYSLKNPSQQCRALLSNPIVAQAIALQEKKRVNVLLKEANLLGINRESILLKTKEIVDSKDSKNADRLASLALQAKILGLTKDQNINQTTIFGAIMQQSKPSNVVYDDEKPTTCSGVIDSSKNE